MAELRQANFDELIVVFIGKVLTGKRLEGKTLMNCLPFVKFVRLFQCQSFPLYGILILFKVIGKLMRPCTYKGPLKPTI